MISNNDKPLENTFAFVSSFIQSLLTYWPQQFNSNNDVNNDGRSHTVVRCPSVLLCSPPQNGKSYLIQTVVQEFNRRNGGKSSNESSTINSNNTLICIQPDINRALTAKAVGNNTNILTSIIQKELDVALERVGSNLNTSHAKSKTNTNTKMKNNNNISVIVVLDHLELFLGVNEELSSIDDHTAKVSSFHQSYNMPEHTSFFTDLCLLLKSSPLFSFGDSSNNSNDDDKNNTSVLFEQNKNDLHFNRSFSINSVMFVGLFTGEEVQISPQLKKLVFDYYFYLETPNESERIALLQTFFSHNYINCNSVTKEVNGENDKADHKIIKNNKLILYLRSLAFRCGGISYGGLCRLAGVALSVFEETFPSAANQAPSFTTADEKEEEERMIYLSQQTLKLFLSNHTSFAHSRDPNTVASTSTTWSSVNLLENCTHVQQYKERTSYVDVQQVKFDDIAGLTEVKQMLKQLILLPLQCSSFYHYFNIKSNLNSNGISETDTNTRRTNLGLVQPRTGVLLHGPPGTGKTLLAKAMATELAASFLYLSLSELVRAEVGEGERRLDMYFALAKERAPCIIFVDELQAVFGRRYAQTDGQGGVNSDAPPQSAGTTHDAGLVSHLLHLLDENHAEFIRNSTNGNKKFVLFVGATNVKEHLDPLLLRAGRLDRSVAVPLPDAAARASLVHTIVYQHWAGWWSATEPSDAIGEAQQEDDVNEKVRQLLVQMFTERTDGKSGAEIHNVLTKFSIKLSQHVIREYRSTSVGDGQTERSLKSLMRKALYKWKVPDNEGEENGVLLSDLVMLDILPQL